MQRRPNDYLGNKQGKIITGKLLAISKEKRKVISCCLKVVQNLSAQLPHITSLPIGGQVVYARSQMKECLEVLYSFWAKPFLRNVCMCVCQYVHAHTNVHLLPTLRSITEYLWSIPTIQLQK